MSSRNSNNYIFLEDYIIIKTKNNEEIYVDIDNFEKISKYCWCISKTGYPVANINYKVVKLHRYLLNILDSKIIVDHINRNPLDNRVLNLRECSVLENTRNTSVSKNNKCGFLGISKTPANRYRARIMVNKKEINLGHYEKIEDAIKSRKIAEIKYFKEFAPI
jgi:hypothetical protein